MKRRKQRMPPVSRYGNDFVSQKCPGLHPELRISIIQLLSYDIFHYQNRLLEAAVLGV